MCHWLFQKIRRKNWAAAIYSVKLYVGKEEIKVFQIFRYPSISEIISSCKTIQYDCVYNCSSRSVEEITTLILQFDPFQFNLVWGLPSCFVLILA